MADRKYTDHDLETHARLARIEEKMEILIQEVHLFKNGFWKVFTPIITIVSGAIAATTARFFNHNN